MKAILGGGAIAAIALLSGSLFFSPSQSFGETLLTQLQQHKQEPTGTQKQGPAADSSAPVDVAVNPSASSPGALAGKVIETSKTSLSEEATELSDVTGAPLTHYVATAYSLRGRT